MSCMIRAVTCTTALRLDRERIILSDQDTASKAINARPGRSALSHHPNPLLGWRRPAGLLVSMVNSKASRAGGHVLVAQ